MSYIKPGETADMDPVASLIACAIHVADLFELLLDSGRFPCIGRSEDDRSAHAQWYDDRYVAVKRLREQLSAVQAARGEL